MKKLISIIILCLACFGGLEAHNYWERIDHVGILLGVGPDGSIYFHEGNSGISRMQEVNGPCPIVIGRETGFPYLFNAHCFCVSPEGRIFVFNNTLNAVMYSDDNGDTWQQMSQVSSCAMEDVAGLYAPNNETVFGWSRSGEIFWTIDSGLSWGASIPVFLTTDNGPLINDLLVNQTGDVYVGIQTLSGGEGIYHLTLSDMQEGQHVELNGNISDMEFDPEGNVVACGWITEGSLEFQHIPGCYLFGGNSLAISDNGIVYTPYFTGHSAVLSYSLDHGEHFTTIGEELPIAYDFVPDDRTTYLFKGADNHLYYVTGLEYWKCLPNADTIPTYNPLIGEKFYDDASGLYYNITSVNTVEVTYDQWHFNTYEGDIVVPETVTYEGVTYTVTGIGERAFQNCEGALTSVVVPNTVRSIGNSAFASSSNLRSVVLTDSVESLGEAVFELCISLASVRVPQNITSIPPRTFAYCESLTSIDIPPRVTSIGKSAFARSGITSITLPETVTTIGEMAFANVESLSSLVIPNTVTSIGEAAFQWCSALTSIQLPENLEVIEAHLFDRCLNLPSIEIPASVTEIRESAFECCYEFKELTIPNTVHVMGDKVFYDCKNLVSVTLPSGLQRIGKSFFERCTRLDSITLPEAVTSIGNWSFYGCHALHEIVIPELVDSIGFGAFEDCTHLKQVELGQSVSFLAEEAFKTGNSNDKLTLICHNPIPAQCGITTFPNAAHQEVVITPCGCEEIYRSAWGSYWQSGSFEEECDPLTEWYYEIENDNGSITYQYLRYAEDTVVSHKDVKIIIRVNTLYDKGDHTETTREYIYEENSKLYWWNKTLGEFTMLYDYQANEGDEWEIKVGDETITVLVDAVEDAYEYNGQLFRVLQVGDDNGVFNGTIVCGIGHLTSFFPERLMNRGKSYRVEGMRCYWVDGELMFKYGEKDCDEVYEELHYGTVELPDDGLMVYPNPTNGVLFVTVGAAAEYRIVNTMGQTLMTGTLTGETQQIDVSKLPKGLYFITVSGVTQNFILQ